MSAPERIGSSPELKALNKILKQLERLTAVISKIGVTTTSTTTAAP